jgi:hypothetical protein
MPASAPCLIWLLSVYWIFSWAAVHSGGDAAPVPLVAPGVPPGAAELAAVDAAGVAAGAEADVVPGAAGGVVDCAELLPLAQPASNVPVTAIAAAADTGKRRPQFVIDSPCSSFVERNDPYDEQGARLVRRFPTRPTGERGGRGPSGGEGLPTGSETACLITSCLRHRGDGNRIVTMTIHYEDLAEATSQRAGIGPPRVREAAA